MPRWAMPSNTTAIPPTFSLGSIAPTTRFELEENAVQDAVVLIVDSEEINRRLLKAIFKTTSYKILEARKASEALRASKIL